MAPIERVIKTIKLRIYKYLTYSRGEKYSSILTDLVDSYNLSPHKGLLGESPLDVHLMFQDDEILSFTQRINRFHSSKNKSVGFILSPVTVVRLTSSDRVFMRSFFTQATDELFRVKTVNRHHTPITYKLRLVSIRYIKSHIKSVVNIRLDYYLMGNQMLKFLN